MFGQQMAECKGYNPQHKGGRVTFASDSSDEEAEAQVVHGIENGLRTEKHGRSGRPTGARLCGRVRTIRASGRIQQCGRRRAGFDDG
jgi:hypothetical protein